MKSNDRPGTAVKKPGSLCPLFSALLFQIAAVLFGLAAGAQGAVTVPAPSWLERTAIADKMVINGLPSTVHHFQANRKLEELLEFYRSRWRANAPGEIGYKEARVAPWHVISRLEGRYLLTVQAKAKDAFSCEGYLAIADLERAETARKRRDNLPRLKGSDIVNDHASFDPGSKARTVLLVNSSSVAGNSDFYRDYYLSRRWGQMVDRQAGDARVLVFGKGGSQVHLVISPSAGKTQVVMNLVDPD